MIKRSFFLLSTAALLSWSANVNIASGSFPNTHTQHTPKLKPTSLDLNPRGAYKIASVCFLGGNCGNDGDFNKGGDDYQIDTALQCKNEGYTTTCASGWHPAIGKDCPYNPAYKTCCKETCPTNSSTSCTGEVVGDDGCGYNCKKCCSASCPSGYDYSENQLTGGSGTGWVKDGNDFCNHCTKGKLYKRKAASVPAGYKTCGCGGTNPFKSGDTTYYQSCNCCSSCSGSTTPSGMRYYNSCYNSCTGQTLYSERSCDNSGNTSCPSNKFPVGYENECGNTVYLCYSGICDIYAVGGESCRDRGAGVIFNIGTNYEAHCRRPDGSTYTKSDGAVYQRGDDCRYLLNWNPNAQKDCETCLAASNPYRDGELIVTDQYRW